MAVYELKLVIVPLLLSAVLLLIRADRPVPRRDENYPSKYIQNFMAEPHRLCVAETGVSEAAVKRFSDEDIFEDDQKLKCYMSCIFHKANVTDDKGELHFIKMMDLIEPEFEDIALKMGSRCMRAKGKDQCERAFWYNKCWKTADPVHYYLL